MTEELCELVDWLTDQQVTHVAMESTGVWRAPGSTESRSTTIYNLLEGLDLTVLVVNAQHIKAVPGRKTDVKDAEWIADLLRPGLVRGSSIPDRPQRELRELVRYRRTLLQQRAQVINRIQKVLEKVLEGANSKLASVANDILGVSGRAMLDAIVADTEDPVALASLARGRLQDKRPALEQALAGSIGPHQRLMIASQLRHIDFIDQEVATVSAEVAARLAEHEEAIARLDAVPGVGRRVAEEVLAEIGTDMTRFPTAANLASWAKRCPSNRERAGKRFSGRTGNGNAWLRQTLTEAAWGASHTKRSYLRAQYHRIAARRGGKRAAIATAHSTLVIIYHLLKRGTTYEDLGPNYFDERDRQAVVRRSVRRIEQLGYTVTVGAA
jgi:transposase